MASWPSHGGPGTTGSGSSHAVMERAWWKVRSRARRTWGSGGDSGGGGRMSLWVCGVSGSKLGHIRGF